MKQNMEAAISMRPIALPASKQNLAMIIARLFASLAQRDQARHSGRGNEQSRLHERDQSAYSRQLLEAKLRETYRGLR